MADFGNVIIEDNSDKIIALLNAAYIRGLVKVGLQAEKFAKQNCPVDTGRLRNSITNQVVTSEKAVYIGTNVEYGKYVELGTGRQSVAGGNPLIAGMKPRPFLKPAATEHKDVYNRLIEHELKNG